MYIHMYIDIFMSNFGLKVLYFVIISITLISANIHTFIHTYIYIFIFIDLSICKFDFLCKTDRANFYWRFNQCFMDTYMHINIWIPLHTYLHMYIKYMQYTCWYVNICFEFLLAVSRTLGPAKRRFGTFFVFFFSAYLHIIFSCEMRINVRILYVNMQYMIISI